MEENKKLIEQATKKEDMQEELEDILSIVQLLEVNVAETGENDYIVRSIRIISKLIKSVITKYFN